MAEKRFDVILDERLAPGDRLLQLCALREKLRLEENARGAAARAGDAKAMADFHTWQEQEHYPRSLAVSAEANAIMYVKADGSGGPPREAMDAVDPAVCLREKQG